MEKKAEHQALQKSTTQIDKKYQIGVIAIIFPILYCLIDGLGTFADAIYLDELSLISEKAALLAYEYTFFICAILSFTYLKFFKKVKFNLFKERDKGFAYHSGNDRTILLRICYVQQRDYRGTTYCFIQHFFRNIIANLPQRKTKQGTICRYYRCDSRDCFVGGCGRAVASVHKKTC